MIGSFRAITSISMGIMLISGLAWNKFLTGKFFDWKIINLFVFAGLLFFLTQLTGLFYTHHVNQQWHAIRLKSCLLIIPLMVSCSGYINHQTRNKLLRGFCAILFAAALYCIFNAFRRWNTGHDPSVFFYFSLVKPLSQHAVQFSILVFIALIHLFESLRKNKLVFSLYIDVLMIIFFTVFIFLLSSRLVISFYLFYLLYLILFILKNKLKKGFIAFLFIFSCTAAGSLVLVTKNPVSERFFEIVQGDMGLIKKEKFDPGIYFNGLQFRLLQWRFVPEILTEKKAWFAGVTSGDKQVFLDQKYVSENMYIGEPSRGDRGFLGYNTHNQFLESLLQSGIIGLIFFLLICAGLIKMMLEKKNREMSFITILLLLYSFTESVFETQYSILIFLFFPLFFYLEKNPDPV